MKYFDLSDDVHVPRRWHLGEIFDRSNNISLEMWTGKGAPYGVFLNSKISRSGIPLEFCLTSFSDPVAELHLANAIAAKAGRDLELLPLEIQGYNGYKEFQILNSVRVIKCLDESRSHFTKWTDKDHRADLAGQYRMVTKLKVDLSNIPQDAHFFRIEGWRIALIVSEQVKSTMETSGCLGAHFEEVT